MRGGGLAITHGGTSFRLHRLESLHDLGFLERKGNVVFPGRPFGVGETHEEMHLGDRARGHGFSRPANHLRRLRPRLSLLRARRRPRPSVIRSLAPGHRPLGVEPMADAGPRTGRRTVGGSDSRIRRNSAFRLRLSTLHYIM